MYKTSTFLCFVLLLALLPANTYSFAQNKDTELKIGVRAINGPDKAKQQWTGTSEYLSNKIQGYRFTLVPILGFSEMRQMIENRQIDFVLTNPLAYVDLNKQYGVTRILTLNKKQSDGVASTSFASVIFTHADNTEINQLKNIKNNRIMAVHPEAFGGWKIAYREFILHGIDPFQESSELTFSASNTHQEVIDSVLNKKTDIGIIRSGIIERLTKEKKIPAGSLKIINKHNDGLTNIHSTQHYPEWPFAVLNHVDNDLSNKVFHALLKIKPESSAASNGNYINWTAPLDYNEVNQLIDDLEYQHITLSDIWRDYKFIFLICLSFLLSTILYTLYLFSINRKLAHSEYSLSQYRDHLEELVEERTRELQREVKMHEKTEHELSIAKAAADKANHAKSSFISEMSHELRTPLNSILGFSQLIQMSSHGDKSTLDNANEIITSGKHLLSLINEILDLSKLESGKIELNLETIKCDEIIEDSITLVSSIALINNIEIIKQGSTTCFILGDKKRLKQVCINLLSNAIKYNKKNGSITVEVQDIDNSFCELQITDNGQGMTNEFQKQLFQPFARAKETAQATEGTGLGLLITKKLIEEMHGEISFTSTHGKGTQFRVRLPASQPL